MKRVGKKAGKKVGRNRKAAWRGKGNEKEESREKKKRKGDIKKTEKLNRDQVNESRRTKNELRRNWKGREKEKRRKERKEKKRKEREEKWATESCTVATGNDAKNGHQRQPLGKSCFPCLRSLVSLVWAMLRSCFSVDAPLSLLSYG